MSLSADDAKKMAFTLMTYADLMESAYAMTTWISVDNFKKLVISYLVNLVNEVLRDEGLCNVTTDLGNL